MSSDPEKRLYILFSEDAEVHADADEKFKDAFRLGQHTLLIRTDMVTEDAATAIGILGEGDSKDGVIIKANRTYVGYFNGKLWDWLD